MQLKALLFEPSKNGSPLSPKMREPWANVPLSRWMVDSSVSYRFPTIHLKNRRTFTLFTSCMAVFSHI